MPAPAGAASTAHPMSSELLRAGDLVELARRRRRALAAAAVVGAVLGFVWMVVKPPAYASSSLVLVQGAPAGGKLAESEAQIAASGAVLSMAAAALGDPSADTLAKRVKASNEGVTMVRISAAAPDRAEAQRIATGVTDAYLRYAADLSAANATAATRALIPLRDNLRAQLDTADVRIAEKRNEPLLPATAPSPQLAVRMPAPQLEQLEAERSRIVEDLGLAEQSISRQLAALPPHTVLSPANLPDPISPLRWIGTGLGGAVAVSAAALVLLVWRASRDPRVYDGQQIAAACGAPLTAVLPGAGSGLEGDREQAHYALAAERMRSGAGVAGESPPRVALISVEGDPAGTAAARRVAEALAASTVRVLSVSRAWPLVDDPLPGERVFLVVGSGALILPTLLAVGGALREANLSPAGVLVIEATDAAARANDERPTRTGG